MAGCAVLAWLRASYTAERSACFWLVVCSGFDFPVSYMFDWLLVAIGLGYSALAEIVLENGGPPFGSS
jgi:hypothetical protein